MDSHFFTGLAKFKVDAGKSRHDDDFADRFNHTFSTLLLVIFTLVISARQYIGKPIACWVPTEFTRAQEEYAESVCWVTSTYFVEPRAQTFSPNPAVRAGMRFHYYQWVPFVLMIQAFLFNVPYIIWRLFNWQSGINLSSIMEVACDIELIKDPETRRANVMYVASHIEDSLAVKRDHKPSHGFFVRCFALLSKCCCIWIGKRRGNYLIVLYLITKLLYIFNVIGQFALMMRFIGTNYTLYGLDVLRDLAMNNTWELSGNFPRITMCDFEIRKLANIHVHTVQCVLPINMFNEKIYVFLWFWCLILAVISTTSFLQWTCKSTFLGTRVDFIRKFLKFRGVLESSDKHRLFAFVEHYLRQDGVFILRLICTNVGEIVAAEVTEMLWYMFTEHPLAFHKPSAPSSTKSRNNHDPNKRQRFLPTSTNVPTPGSPASPAVANQKPPLATRSHPGKPSSGNGRRRPPLSQSGPRSALEPPPSLRNVDEDPGEVV